jgi:carbamoyl-phosphate synthase large subunit
MPKRTDIHTVFVIGSGPIVIGQAAEFDYSGTQAIKALRAEGYRVVLVNSNPATIMTDPDLADATYIEPLTTEALEAIIEQERPDALLPTVGGQTGLNMAKALSQHGVLERCGVKLIGASLRSIEVAEDRQLFRETMLAHGIPVPKGGAAESVEQTKEMAEEIGYPLIARSSFALGGTGASQVNTPLQLKDAVERALNASPVHQAWLEESLLGWKEFELEVMRDCADNFVVVCSIENLDAMGVHTGDSITVAPAQTLTDREYQVLRDLARRVISAVGVETGGANVQFAVNPQDGRTVVIEMNPRVSRSSALASKATGFAIAKVATLVAVGYTLDEITNDITQQTKASFEPSLDYVVVKLPRWAFEKFPGADLKLGPQMKSVGEVMALGRTFTEALHKAILSLEIGVDAPDGSGPKNVAPSRTSTLQELAVPAPGRLFDVYRALQGNTPLQSIAEATGYDLWFLAQMEQVARLESELSQYTLPSSKPRAASEPNNGSAFGKVGGNGFLPVPAELLRHAKRAGLADSRLAHLFSHAECAVTAQEVRAYRTQLGIVPTFLRVDTCAAEFEAQTPYLYSSYEVEDEANCTGRPKIMILGSGPNRIGQGIEFDYCCCQAVFALRELGYETIMVNCNPETVSTDYDTADRLYFEPLTLEHVLNIVEREQPQGVIVQLGGQTPLNLANALEAAGVPVIGTSPHSIDLAEDRRRFAELLSQLDIPQPENGIANSVQEAREIAQRMGYPLLVRPSYVLGGRAMRIVEDDEQLDQVLQEAIAAAPGQPLLVDRFLEDAYEADVDALGDGERVVIGAVMQHIEEAGVHSGDSTCVLPPYRISAYHLETMREYTERLGLALNVRGLMNVQFAIKDDVVYVLEVNPRASRTVPYASKAVGMPLARLATLVMVGRRLAELNFVQEIDVDGFFVKEAVLPFKKLHGSDAVLGPEMHSTGEVMGHASNFGHAFAKAQLAAGAGLPLEGNVLISVNDYDKGAALKIARDLHRMGFGLYATSGTAKFLRGVGLPTQMVNKVSQGMPHVVDVIRQGKIHLIVNTPRGRHAHFDGIQIRRAALAMDVPLLTTLSAAAAAVNGIRALRARALRYRSLQEHFERQACRQSVSE